MAAASSSSSANSREFDHLFLEAGVKNPPYCEGNKYLVHGELRTWNGPTVDVHSPVWIRGSDKPLRIGTYGMLSEKEALEAVESAAAAFDHGRGAWPTSTPKERIAVIETYVKELQKKRDEIVNLLMWEICKTQADAEKEVDRTIKYIQDTIKAVKDLENKESTFVHDTGFVAHIRRAPLGISLCCGPFNYPFNETYTTVIPALIMGNPVIMKLPRTGVLCHIPTLEIFQRVFPKGVINVISGSGRKTLPPVMAHEQLGIFAFIGTSKAADELQKCHPKPHRLRVCLGLEAKNPAIVTPSADLDTAVTEVVLGGFS